jgi:hypothetical protein
VTLFASKTGKPLLLKTVTKRGFFFKDLFRQSKLHAQAHLSLSRVFGAKPGNKRETVKLLILVLVRPKLSLSSLIPTQTGQQRILAPLLPFIALSYTFGCVRFLNP